MKAKEFADISKMSREDWLKERRKGIGGSDAGAILGLNPYVSSFQVYCDKLGLIPEQPDNEAMRQGRDFEDYVAKRFEEKEGKKVRRCGYMLQHPTYDWALANVDRMVVGEHAGLECKTTSVLTRTQYDKGDIPAQYYVQCMHYLAVTGFSAWYLAVLILNKGFYVFTVERDEDEIRNLLEKEHEFWESHILLKIPPEPDGSDRAEEVIKQLHPESTDAPPVGLYGDEGYIRTYLSLNEKIKALKRQQSQLQQKIQLKLGDSSEGLADGYKIRWPSQNQQRIDTDRLKAEQPEIYEKYLKTISFRKFKIEEIKINV